jgi:hypothetical protein
LAALCQCVAPALGQNVDLSTVPKRDTAHLTIYNSEDLTLVTDAEKADAVRRLLAMNTKREA